MSKDDAKKWKAADAKGPTGLQELLDRIYGGQSFEDISTNPKDKKKGGTKRKTTEESTDLEEEVEEPKTKKALVEGEESEEASDSEADKTGEEKGKGKVSKDVEMKDAKPGDSTKTGRKFVKPRPKGGGGAGLLESRHVSGKAFRVPGSIRLLNKEICLDRNSVQADQGSDFNIVSERLTRRYGLPIQPLSALANCPGSMTVRMADGRETSLSRYSTFDFGVAGVWRKVDCLVLPDNMTSDLAYSRTDGAQLLLGIPWLYDVRAVISIRNFAIEIGDPSRGENVQRLDSQKQVFRPHHNLWMYAAEGEVLLDKTESYTTGQMFAAQATGPLLNGAVSNQGLPVEPSLQEVYHDLTVSKFRLGDMPAWTYFLDFDTPEADPSMSTTTADGAKGWVDLSQFIILLKRDSALPPVDGRPQLSSGYFQMLETWLPATGAYPGGADALLGIFLTTFFDSETSAQIMCKHQVKTSRSYPRLTFRYSCATTEPKWASALPKYCSTTRYWSSDYQNAAAKFTV